MKKEAKKLFCDKEGKELRGKNGSNFWLMSFIFFLSVIGIGFGSASLNYLRHKMDDPFVQWIDIKANQGNNDKTEMSLTDFLNTDDYQKLYGFADPQPNYVLNCYFRHSTEEKDIQLVGRSIKTGSPILKKIMETDNVVRIRDGIAYNDSEIGIIITEEALKKLGYNDPPSFVNISLPYDKESSEACALTGELNGYYAVAFPIFAVVHQLPGMKSFLFTERFLHDNYSPGGRSWDITSEENNQELTVCGDKETLMEISNKIEGDYICRTDDYDGSWKHMKCLHISSKNYSSAFEYNNLFSTIKKETGRIVRLYDFVASNDYYESTPEYYSIQMQSLDSVESFHECLNRLTGMHIEMASIDAKKNFRFVQRMGSFLSVCVIMLSIVFICVFIYSLLNSHFLRIQKNLGTFKAFGVNNQSLFVIYMTLMLRITLLSFITAMATAYTVSLFLGLFSKIEGVYPRLNVWAWQNFLLVALAIAAVVIVTHMVSRQRLKHTPGDLIYSRNL